MDKQESPQVHFYGTARLPIIDYELPISRRSQKFYLAHDVMRQMDEFPNTSIHLEIAPKGATADLHILGEGIRIGVQLDQLMEYLPGKQKDASLSNLSLDDYLVAIENLYTRRAASAAEWLLIMERIDCEPNSALYDGIVSELIRKFTDSPYQRVYLVTDHPPPTNMLNRTLTRRIK